MPQYEGAISHLRQDVIDGDIHRDLAQVDGATACC
jgi:hypothetical protein